MCKRLCGAITISGFVLLAGIGSAAPEAICRPHLELNPFRATSGVFPRERTWKAELTGYSSQCREETGLIQLEITRLKDNAPDLSFLVTEVWRAGRSEIELTTAADEAIYGAEIMWISRCSCSPRTVVSDRK
jgi:hypothetical protein